MTVAIAKLTDLGNFSLQVNGVYLEYRDHNRRGQYKEFRTLDSALSAAIEVGATELRVLMPQPTETE